MTATHPAAAFASVVGVVFRPDGQTTVTGATVVLEGQPPVTTAGDGTFRFVKAPVGRRTLTITAPGFTPWRTEVGVAPGVVVTARLVPAAVATVVTTTGATVSSGISTLTVPADAFASNTSVSFTYLDSRSVAFGFGASQFRTTDTRSHRVYAGISITSSAQPALPVDVTLPYIPGKTVALWFRDAAGEWSEPITPQSMTATTATFQLTHFSEYVAAYSSPEDDPEIPFVVSSTSGTVMAAMPGGEVTQLAPGDLVPPGTTVTSGKDSSVTLTDGLGNISILDHESQAVMATCLDMTLCAPASTDLDLRLGGVRAIVNERIMSTKPKFRIRNQLGNQSIGTGVRGTVLEVELPACSDSTRALQNVTVFEGGPVDVNDQIVASGTVLSLCDGCPTNAEPRCDDCPSYHWVADQTHEQVLQSCYGQISINGTVSLCDTPNPYDPWLGMEFEGEGSRRIVSGTDSSIGILPRGGTNMCLGDYELRYPAEFGGVHAVIYAVHQPSGSTTTSIRGQYNLTGTNVLIQCDCRWTATSTIVE